MSNQNQPHQCRTRLTFNPRSKVQQAIFDHLKDEPDLIMTALIDRYSFLALAEIDRPEKELAKALIESNAALMKAIEINNAIAARQGIAMGKVTAVSSPSPIPAPPPSTKVENPDDDDDDDWDEDDFPEPPKKSTKPMSAREKEIEEMMNRL
jgi:hypothetical protein